MKNKSYKTGQAMKLITDWYLSISKKETIELLEALSLLELEEHELITRLNKIKKDK